MAVAMVPIFDPKSESGKGSESNLRSQGMPSKNLVSVEFKKGGLNSGTEEPWNQILEQREPMSNAEPRVKATRVTTVEPWRVM